MPPAQAGGMIDYPLLNRARKSWVSCFWGLVKIWSLVPSSQMTPSAMKTTRSETSLAKAISWVTTSMVMPSFATCNRAAVVTFLWRAAGSPEPESTDNPFADVKESDFYYKPVLWAIENGITNGVDATHFGPTTACNRAQVVTFLYRAYN